MEFTSIFEAPCRITREMIQPETVPEVIVSQNENL